MSWPNAKKWLMWVADGVVCWARTAILLERKHEKEVDQQRLPKTGW